MTDIFMTYASADRSMAKKVAEMLVGNGYSVWWDRLIPPGKTYDEVIEEALNSAKCVVVLWSENSVVSDWVKNEATEGARRRILVPILLHDVRIPLEFRRIQAASLSGWKPGKNHPELKGLFNSINEIIGRDSSGIGEKQIGKKVTPEEDKDDENRKLITDSSRKIIKRLTLVLVVVVWIAFILFAVEPNRLPPFLIMWLILLGFLVAAISGISLTVTSYRIRFHYSTAMGVISSLGYLYSSMRLIDLRNGAAILDTLLVFGVLVLVLGLFALFGLRRLRMTGKHFR